MTMPRESAAAGILAGDGIRPGGRSLVIEVPAVSRVNRRRIPGIPPAFDRRRI